MYGRFGSTGYVQSILYGLAGNAQDAGFCYIGLTGPFARKHIDKHLVLFSIPYRCYIEVENQMEGSF